MSENYLTINENGEPLTETISGVTMPIDYSFANINDFVNGVDVHFEELQSLCLGMSCHIEQQAETIDRLKSMNAALLEGIKTVKTAYYNYMTASQSDAVFAHIEMQEAFKTLNKLEAGEL